MFKLDLSSRLSATCLGVLCVAASSCVGSELSVATSHPGHPDASQGLLSNTSALGSALSSSAEVHRQPPSAAQGEHAEPAHPVGGEHAHHAPARRAHDHAGAQPPDAKAPAASYTCPMHPEVVRDQPGRCPSCGMNLVPRKDAR